MLETGAVIFFWCTVAVSGLSVLLLLLGLLWKSDGLFGASAVGGGVATVCLIVAAFVFFPYNAKYFTWGEKEGVVVASEYTKEVGNGRYDNEGGLKITLSSGIVGYTTDFRLAKYGPGEPVVMLCKPEFIHNNADRYRCRALTGG